MKNKQLKKLLNAEPEFVEAKEHIAFILKEFKNELNEKHKYMNNEISEFAALSLAQDVLLKWIEKIKKAEQEIINKAKNAL